MPITNGAETGQGVIQQYLDLVGGCSGVFAEVVTCMTNRGSWVERSRHLDQEQWGILEDLGIYEAEHEIGLCWYNAQRFASAASHNRKYRNRIKYWEGIATPGFPLPVEHAWCTIDGLIIDLTWFTNYDVEQAGHRNRSWKKKWVTNRPLGIIPEGFAYFGVEITSKRIYPMWLKNGITGAILPFIWMEECKKSRSPVRGLPHREKRALIAG